MQKTGLPYPKALARLRKADDSMREAIGEDIEPRLAASCLRPRNRRPERRSATRHAIEP